MVGQYLLLTYISFDQTSPFDLDERCPEPFCYGVGRTQNECSLCFPCEPVHRSPERQEPEPLRAGLVKGSVDVFHKILIFFFPQDSLEKVFYLSC